MKKIFPDIIGNDELCRRLAHGLSFDIPDLPHAYIIEGAYGTGKHTLARSLAAALVCERRTDPSAPALPCGECRACRMIASGICPDVIEFGDGDKTSIGVDAIRELRRDIHIYPNDLERKIYIINRAHEMTSQAQNALLLTLEEPPSYAFILLLCENAGQLLETVKSRAPILRIRPLSPENTERALLSSYPRLASVRQQDPVLFSDVIMSSDGSAGLAADLLIGKEAEKISSNRRAAERFCILAADQSKGAELLLHLTDTCTASRDTAQEQLDTISLALRDLALLKKAPDAPLRFFSNRDAALSLCDSYSLRRLLTLSDAVSDAVRALSRNMNVRLTLLSMLAELEYLS